MNVRRDDRIAFAVYEDLHSGAARFCQTLLIVE